MPSWLYPANLLTELRLIAVPAIVFAVLQQRYGWASLFFFAAGISDGFDGYLARRFHQQSTLGAYLDPLADKSLLVALFITLALRGWLPWALTILVIVRDACILVAALVVYALTGFRDFRPIWVGKAATTAELATVGVALLYAASLSRVARDIDIFGWVCVTGFSLLSGILYAFTCATRYHDSRG